MNIYLLGLNHIFQCLICRLFELEKQHPLKICSLSSTQVKKPLEPSLRSLCPFILHVVLTYHGRYFQEGQITMNLTTTMWSLFSMWLPTFGDVPSYFRFSFTLAKQPLCSFKAIFLSPSASMAVSNPSLHHSFHSMVV